MKGFEKFLLVVFSLIVVTLSIFVILISTEMLEYNSNVQSVFNWLVQNKFVGLIVGAIFALLSLFGLFSTSSKGENMKSGLALKEETGTVYITRETFESIILSVTKNYKELKNVKVDINVTPDGIIANVFTFILPNTIVPEITVSLQEDIKNSVLKQTTIEIKEANIKIKGVYTEPQRR